MSERYTVNREGEPIRSSGVIFATTIDAPQDMGFTTLAWGALAAISEGECPAHLRDRVVVATGGILGGGVQVYISADDTRAFARGLLLAADLAEEAR